MMVLFVIFSINIGSDEFGESLGSVVWEWP